MTSSIEIFEWVLHRVIVLCLGTVSLHIWIVYPLVFVFVQQPTSLFWKQLLFLLNGRDKSGNNILSWIWICRIHQEHQSRLLGQCGGGFIMLCSRHTDARPYVAPMGLPKQKGWNCTTHKVHRDCHTRLCSVQFLYVLRGSMVYADISPVRP